MIDIDRLELNCRLAIESGHKYLPATKIDTASDMIELITRLRQAEKDAERYRLKSEKYDEILSHASSGDDVAVSIDGDVYHHVAMTYEMAEDAECVSMCLDDAGVPDCDENGVRYSLWGRVSRFSTYSTPCDEIGATQCK